MKKIIALLSMFILSFSVPIIVKADNVGSVTVQSYTDLQAWYNEHGSPCTDQVATYFYDTFVDGSQDDILLIYYNGWNYFYSGTVTQSSEGFVIDTSVYTTAQKWTRYDGTRSVNPSEFSTAVLNNTAIYSLVAEPIDFNNIIYDPFIPTPDYTVTYSDDFTSLPRFPLDVALTNSSGDYYVEVIMENMTPSFVGVKPDGTFEAFLYYQFATRFVYPMEGLTKSNELGSQLLSASLSSAWRNDILSYDPTDSNSFYVPVSDSDQFGDSLAYTGLCLKYNIYRQIACFYGNNTGISIRYFRIENGQVYAGKIRSWTNLYGGVFSESIPEYYKPYEEAQGYERDVMEIVPVETASPNNKAPSNQFGKKTGLNININIGSSVPNYPNYPTVASYNLDNLLVQTIDRSEDIGGFLSGVSGFAQSALAFIPDYVWQLVAFGLGLSIIVMFLKIL